jgi:hypothetical protein
VQQYNDYEYKSLHGGALCVLLLNYERAGKAGIEAEICRLLADSAA